MCHSLCTINSFGLSCSPQYRMPFRKNQEIPSALLLRSQSLYSGWRFPPSFLKCSQLSLIIMELTLSSKLSFTRLTLSLNQLSMGLKLSPYPLLFKVFWCGVFMMVYNPKEIAKTFLFLLNKYKSWTAHCVVYLIIFNSVNLNNMIFLHRNKLYWESADKIK